MGKSTGKINNIGYKWYIGSQSMQSPGASDRVSPMVLNTTPQYCTHIIQGDFTILLKHDYLIEKFQPKLNKVKLTWTAN